ncbi:MAG: ATP-binding protein [Nitrospirae bacterium CG_4_10_14_3_um_filter_44_29]|nr:MinD/ParA family protein [Nitrospirota bacterium]PIV67323.1 MAG: ATP-binding protein [Nitrospirae bacterium CG01_land_8_20_14_3_00_44_22]PIW90249.1 MAG: ATP-binding protein [Nitrospirae bacterium CG_4_8_14_3_um_filter_44_28]PIX88911.1 MAG: ATP-binding protein [Nitrospirae bacterium CG_4_10_14_3_um_filter_44_29]
MGGGKGGTGKSFVTSGIGTHLVSKGKRVVMIDADLGGANLHTFLGVSKPRNSLTDFFEKKVPLNNIIVNCSIPDMGLVSGTLSSLDSENIKYVQKLKLFRQIKEIDTDYILIDLGAGSHNNTIDTFLLADKMIVVTTAEITALENMYHFVKNVFFRKLKITLGAHGLKDMIQDVWKNRDVHGIKHLKDVVDHLMGTSTHIRDILEKELSSFRIYIVLNQIRSGRETMIGVSVKSVCLKFLGFNAMYAGHIEYDETVLRCINKRLPFMLTHPFSHVAKEIGKLTENLRDGRQASVMTDKYAHRRL